MLSGSGDIDSMKVIWTLLCQQWIYTISFVTINAYNAFVTISTI